MLALVSRVLRLFDAGTKRRFALAIAGSLVIAFAEVLAVLAILPLMQLVTGASTDTGALPWLRELFGNPSDTRLAAYISVLVLFGFIAKGLVSMAIRWWTLGFLARQGVTTASELMRYYLSAPLSLHSRRGSADLLRVMGDGVAQVYAQVIGGGMGAITEGITIVAMSVTLLVVSPLPTLAVALFFLVAGTVLQVTLRSRAAHAGQRTIHAAYTSTRTALQALGGIREIKLRGEQDVFVERYADSRLEVGLALRTTTFLSDVPRYAMEILFVLGIGVMTIVIYANEPSDRALGTLALFAVAGYRVLPSTVRLLASMNLIRAGGGALDLVERDLGEARSFREQEAPATVAMPFEHAVRLDRVWFSYDDSETPVLRDISLDLPAGSSLGLVGVSGAGKSTLVDIVLGLQSPTRGRVLVDAADIAPRLKDWQQNLAVVPQDVYLLDDTMRANVRFSPDVDDPDDRRLHHVLAQAQLGELVASLPAGVDSELGERGARISGGQRQRVGIARALFREPKLLVLDEATSALDNETERMITETIRSLQGDVTLIVIAHRLSTVRHCDRIAVLEEGRLTGLGSFDELRRSHAGFARLVELGSLVGSEIEARP